MGLAEPVSHSLTAYIEKRRGYDYNKRSSSDNPFLDFITLDMVTSFCGLGSPVEHVAKLKELQQSGVTQFNIYLDNGREEEIIATYADAIIPQFMG